MRLKSLFPVGLLAVASASPAERRTMAATAESRAQLETRDLSASELVGAITSTTKLSSDLADVVEKLDTGTLGLNTLLNPAQFVPVVTGFQNIIVSVGVCLVPKLVYVITTNYIPIL